jgi:hypothetical protein
MPSGEPSVEQVVMTRLLRVSAVVSGIVTGLLVGLGIFVATNWLVLKGGPVVGPHLGLLGQFLIGYQVSFGGSLIGFGYGFVIGFVVGSATAWLYNRFLDRRGSRGAAAR